MERFVEHHFGSRQGFPDCVLISGFGRQNVYLRRGDRVFSFQLHGCGRLALTCATQYSIVRGDSGTQRLQSGPGLVKSGFRQRHFIPDR